MRRFRRLAAGCALAAMAADKGVAADPVASPKENCSTYVGQKIAPISFEEAVAKLPRIAPKNQYETTAAYQERLAHAAPAFAEPLIVRKERDKRDLEYDADKGILPIHDTGFGSEVIGLDAVAPVDKAVRYNGLSADIGFRLASKDRSSTTYTAQNGYGASFEVRHVVRDIGAIWERPSKLSESAFVGKKPYTPLMAMKLDPAAARDMIERASMAFALRPKSPFIATGVYNLGPSPRMLQQREDHFTVIIADISCALLMDGQSNVAAAFAVK